MPSVIQQHPAGVCTEDVFLEGATLQRQPPDGSCLFHSVRVRLAARGVTFTSTTAFRKAVMRAVRQHKQTLVNGMSIADWVRSPAASHVHVRCRACRPAPHPIHSVDRCAQILAETGKDIDTYLSDMRSSLAWGGLLELAVTSMKWRCRIELYDPVSVPPRRWRRAHAFGVGEPVRLSFNGSHYDALDGGTLVGGAGDSYINGTSDIYANELHVDAHGIEGFKIRFLTPL
jgi:hypothetical protein